MPSASIACRLCNSESPSLGTKELLGKYDVSYYQCSHCELTQVEKPYWLEEAYAEPIAALDVGALDRVQQTTQITQALIYIMGTKNFKTYVDFGGGSGLFTRWMRNQGYNFQWYDRYCKNTFAIGFEANLSQETDWISSFEVFEHLADVEKETDAIFAMHPKILFVGTLLSWKFDFNWWYLTPETGQHIAFYSPKTMDFLAEKHGYQRVSGHAYTLFIRKDMGISQTKKTTLQKLLYRPLLLSRMGRALRFFFGRPSLASKDQKLVLDRY